MPRSRGEYPTAHTLSTNTFPLASRPLTVVAPRSLEAPSPPLLCSLAVASRPLRPCAPASVALALAALCAAPSALAQTAPGPHGFQSVPYRFVVGAVSTSALLHADSVCPGEGNVCPFGGGGGLLIGVGRRYRSSAEWALSYDLSVRNARNLFSSATLQQVRFEHRWVLWSPRSNLEVYGGFDLGVAFFGERFGVATLGPLAGLLGGGNYHMTAFFSVGLLLRLEALRFLVPFDTGDGVSRSVGGVASVIGTGYLTLTFRGP